MHTKYNTELLIKQQTKNTTISRNGDNVRSTLANIHVQVTTTTTPV